MNITDFIVKHLQKGKSVEIPGIGTLTPVGQQITLKNAFSNDKTIVEYIAEKECVNESIAEMMWKNYVDALTDKLAHSGSHDFEGVGELLYNDGIYEFRTKLVKPTVEDTLEAQVVGNVKKYTKKDDEDPFNVFEQPIREDIIGTPGIEKKENVNVVDDEDVITTVYEANAMREQNKATEPKPIEQKPIEQKSIEQKPVETEIHHESVAEKVEPIEEKPVNRMEKRDEAEEARIEEARKESIQQNEASDEVKRDLLSTPLDSKKDRKRRERKERKDKKAAKKLEKKVKYRSSNVSVTKASKEGKKKRKKGRILLIILLILLLLIIGGGVYYFFFAKKASPKVVTTEITDNKDYGVENDFTTNMDLIEYTTEERWDEVVRVCAYMEDYIGNYLDRRGYGKAKSEMMVRVEGYVNTRIDTLLSTNTFSVRRFIPYEDYIYNSYYDCLKVRKAKGARVKIQTELMNMGMLKELMDAMVLELGLVSDRKFVAVNNNDYDMPLPKVNTEKRSKNGFDIVAGFYTNYQSAVRMTASLKKWGCDAYIIEKNSGYYVSMGSAKTRTAAEALLTHIKSWYDGDVVIKQVD